MLITKKAAVDHEKCRLCSKCSASRACPQDAFQRIDGYPFVHTGVCRGCGKCAAECPHEAVILSQ